MVALNTLCIKWMHEQMNEQKAYVVCALFPDDHVVDQVLCAGHDSIWHLIKLLSKLSH